MTFYEKSIMEVTGCSIDDVAEVEDIMRNTIVHSTLDWLSPSQFKKAAIEAKEVFDICQDPAKMLNILDDEALDYVDLYTGPVKYRNPQEGEEHFKFKIVNFNKVTQRCYIEVIEPASNLPSQELVSVNDIIFIKPKTVAL